MADISTSLMGLRLASPVVLGASSLSHRVDNIKAAEDSGVGAVVIHSLFQEQIEMEAEELDLELSVGSEAFAESITYFPHLEHAGPREHLMWIEKTRGEVKAPLIGSLNATTTGNWVDYARLLVQAGCDALELNLYAVQTDPGKSSAEIEEQSLEVVQAVKAAVNVPVAVKLSPFYTSVATFAKRVAEAGADGLVLFNRFYQPTIDINKETLKIELDLSTPEENRVSVRWLSILSGDMKTDLVGCTGVHTGEDAIRMILAGAKAVQVVSAVYRHGIEYVTKLNREVAEWMDAKGYARIEDFRGKLDQKHISDPYAFERAQYIKLLLAQKPVAGAAHSI